MDKGAAVLYFRWAMTIPHNQDRPGVDRRLRKPRFHRDVIETLEVSDQLAVLCVGGVIQEINGAGCILLDVSREEVAGRRLSDFVTPDYAPILDELLSFALVELSPVPMLFVRPDGSAQEASLLVHPARELGPGHAVVTARDLSHERRLAVRAQSMDDRNRQLVEQAMHMICQCRGGEVISMNRAGRELLRLPPDQTPTGWQIWDIFQGEYRDIIAEDVSLLFDDRAVLPVRLRTFDGEAIDAQIRITPLSREANPPHYMLEARDITAHNRAVAALRKMNDSLEHKVRERTQELELQKAFVENLLEAIPNPVWWKDTEGRFLGYNKAFCGFLGVEPGQWIGQKLADVLAGVMSDQAAAHDQDALAGHHVVYELSLGQPGAGERHVLVNKTGWMDEQQQPAGVIGVMVDITERKAMEADLHRLATTDSLSGCWNRRYFLERSEGFLKTCRAQGRPMALVMLDIDHFKRINDTHGHPTGDAAIRAVAETCRAVVGDKGCIGRLGGEEFGLALPGMTQPQAVALAEEIRHAVAALVVASEAGEPVTFTTSLGTACSLSTEGTAQCVLARADQALYEAKRSGRNKVVAF